MYTKGNLPKTHARIRIRIKNKETSHSCSKFSTPPSIPGSCV